MTTSRLKHFGIVGLLLVAAVTITVILYRGLQIDQSKIPSALIGQPANDFSADWIQGQTLLVNGNAKAFSLQDLRGKIVLLNFWASWCVSCRAEARDMEVIWQKYGDRGVAVVGVAIQDTIPAAREFAGVYGKTYILGLDTDGKAAIDYGVSGVPESFLIDRDGKIVYKETGPIDRAAMEKLLEKMLAS